MNLYYIGKPYPHRNALLELKSLGYSLGLIVDSSHQTQKNIDLFDNILALDFSSETAFRRDIDSIKLPHIDGILCTYENYIVFKTIIAEKLGIPSLDYKSALACTDKYEMRKLFAAENQDLNPPFSLAETEANALLFATQIGYPVILKPANLVKSLLVSKCNNDLELIKNYRQAREQIVSLYNKLGIIDRNPRLIVEKFIDGRMCSIAAFTDASGTPYLCDGITDLVMAREVGFDDNFLYARKLLNEQGADMYQQLMAVARLGIKALGMKSSPAHVELIYNEDGVKIIEIGARIGGYRHFLYQASYGINLIEQEARVTVGDTPKLNGSFLGFSAMYELFPRTTGVFSHLSGEAHDNKYAYYRETVLRGETVGLAKDGYKASAIIGITSPNIKDFAKQCHEVESMQVVVE